ncbi:unnamed protein product [Brassicogethes aeneus]|uniref:Uncharacterized protein n=1 Tax=Brassicogethes aeneus TaxID=1431903 RepID=A0A9P0AR39_BRAAE|nr:unnamed protein product [Brassicogethes aeneus]
MRSNIRSELSLIILQVLWKCQMIYESYILRINRNDNTLESTHNTLTLREPSTKRHIIHLSTEERINARPVCFMQVLEVISPFEEEMLRCACAKGVSVEKNEQNAVLPSEVISRKSFTDIWLDSFNLVA